MNPTQNPKLQKSQHPWWSHRSKIRMEGIKTNPSGRVCSQHCAAETAAPKKGHLGRAGWEDRPVSVPDGWGRSHGHVRGRLRGLRETGANEGVCTFIEIKAAFRLSSLLILMACTWTWSSIPKATPSPPQWMFSQVKMLYLEVWPVRSARKRVWQGLRFFAGTFFPSTKQRESMKPNEASRDHTGDRTPPKHLAQSPWNSRALGWPSSLSFIRYYPFL